MSVSNPPPPLATTTIVGLVRSGAGLNIDATGLLGVNTPSGPPQVTTITANYTMTGADSLVLVNASHLTITLPDATVTVGRLFWIKNKILGTATILAGPSGQTIDGAATYTLGGALQGVSLTNDGASWFLV